MKNIITDFGAVGDGVTDDTIAFQNAAASNKPVQATYTTGGYLVSGTSTFGQFSRLIGEPGTKIIHSGSSDVFLLSASSQLEKCDSFNSATDFLHSSVVMNFSVNVRRRLRHWSSFVRLSDQKYSYDISS